MNSYISFFYIAFVRSQHLQLFGMEYEASSGEVLPLRDSCSTSSWSGERRENDCMGDLFIQMVIVVLGKEVTDAPAAAAATSTTTAATATFAPRHLPPIPV